jgi:hypothetical protein
MEPTGGSGLAVRERGRAGLGWLGLLLGFGPRVGPVAFPFFFVLKLFYFIFCFAFYLLHFGSKLIQTTL